MDHYKEKELANRNKLHEMLKAMPDYVCRYIYSIQNSTTTLTQIGYVTDIRSFFEYLNNPRPSLDDLKALRRDDFYAYLDYLRQYEKDGRICSNEVPALKRKLSSLRGLWAYLYNEDLLPENVLSKVNMPKLRRKGVIRLDTDEKAVLLNSIEHPSGTRQYMAVQRHQRCRDRAITALLLSTGIRVSELCNINMDDLNIDKCAIRIVRKGDKEDMVYFSDECRAVLSEWISERNNDKKIDKSEKALFVSRLGTRICARQVEKLVKRYALGINKHITPHKLRSTYGTELYEKTGDIYLVAQALGHNSVDTTSRHYISSSDKKKEENRNRIRLNS